MRRSALVVLLVLAAVTGALPPAAGAAEPPNQNDPCSVAARNTCDTNGVGRYDTYRYGLRWFGDYRGAVDGVDDPLFCIDLRFWYPSKAFAYERRSANGLRNRDGDRVSTRDLRRMAYAIQREGRSRNPVRQAAVMLYVHRLMGDGAPGEVAADATGPAVERTYRAISRNAERFAGPYRVETTLARDLVSGVTRTLEVRVVAASGAAVPNVRLALSGDGAAALPRAVTTGATGRARIAVTPDDAAGDLDLAIAAEGMPATAPAIYVPTRGAARRSGQRLAGPATATVATRVARAVEPARLEVATTATPGNVLVGEEVRDTVRISGAPDGWSADVEVRLYGPARTPEAIDCTVAPSAAVTYRATGGETVTPPIVPSAPGWYGFQLVVPSTTEVIGTTTPCVPPEERVKVDVRPTVTTQVTSASIAPGEPLQDSVVVAGLFGETATVDAALYGPFPTVAALRCDVPPVWSASFTATGDGTYLTDPVTLPTPGYYTYQEKIPAVGFVRAAEHPCAEASETTIVRGAPSITTQISAQETAPGSTVTDSVVVTGLGRLEAEVVVELFGPFPSREAIRCDVPPVHRSTFVATGDGTYTTAPVTLTAAGYYTYRETIVGTPAYDAHVTACGEVSETTITKATPEVTTVVSNAVVRPGAELFDRVRVTGLGTTPVTIEVALYGPYASRADIDCAGEPYWRGEIAATGDGEYRTAPVELRRAGFYTYRERIAGSETVAGTASDCAVESETSLAQPLIPTGRGDVVARVSAADATDASGPRPTRVRLDRLGIDAPVSAVGIDTRAGVLDVPANIDRVGWWRDGAAPGSARGTTLLAGHVDSARRGAGAFALLRGARRGDVVSVSTIEGRVRRYRVTGTRTVRKTALPSSIFRRTGPRRLVLVTCGGPFDRARGAYRDNVIVTAVPL